MITPKRIIYIASVLQALAYAADVDEKHSFRLESPTIFDDSEAFHTSSKDAKEDARISTNTAFFPPLVDITVDNVLLPEGVHVRNLWFFEETDDGSSKRSDGVKGICRDTVNALREVTSGKAEPSSQEKLFGPYASLHYLNRESDANGKFIGVSGIRYFSLLAKNEISVALGGTNDFTSTYKFELQVNRPDEGKCVVVVHSEHTSKDSKTLILDQYLDMETFDDKQSRMILHDTSATISGDSTVYASATVLSRTPVSTVLYKTAKQLREGNFIDAIKVDITSTKGTELFSSGASDGLTEANEYMLRRSKLSLIEPVLVKQVLPQPYLNAYCAEEFGSTEHSAVYHCTHIPYDHDVYHDLLWGSEELCVDMEYSEKDGKLISGGGSGISVFNEKQERAFARPYNVKVHITQDDNKSTISHVKYVQNAPGLQTPELQSVALGTPLGPVDAKTIHREQEAGVDTGYLRAVYLEDHDMLQRLQTQRENVLQADQPHMQA